eukprot:Lankesteria_metandrocarpae@DN8300_c1_g1_i1.p1
MSITGDTDTTGTAPGDNSDTDNVGTGDTTGTDSTATRRSDDTPTGVVVEQARQQMLYHHQQPPHIVQQLVPVIFTDIPSASGTHFMWNPHTGTQTAPVGTIPVVPVQCADGGAMSTGAWPVPVARVVVDCLGRCTGVVSSCSVVANGGYWPVVLPVSTPQFHALEGAADVRLHRVNDVAVTGNSRQYVPSVLETNVNRGLQSTNGVQLAQPHVLLMYSRVGSICSGGYSKSSINSNSYTGNAGGEVTGGNETNQDPNNTDSATANTTASSATANTTASSATANTT